MFFTRPAILQIFAVRNWVTRSIRKITLIFKCKMENWDNYQASEIRPYELLHEANCLCKIKLRFTPRRESANSDSSWQWLEATMLTTWRARTRVYNNIKLSTRRKHYFVELDSYLAHWTVNSRSIGLLAVPLCTYICSGVEVCLLRWFFNVDFQIHSSVISFELRCILHGVYSFYNVQISIVNLFSMQYT